MYEDIPVQAPSTITVPGFECPHGYATWVGEENGTYKIWHQDPNYFWEVPKDQMGVELKNLPGWLRAICVLQGHKWAEEFPEPYWQLDPPARRRSVNLNGPSYYSLWKS